MKKVLFLFVLALGFSASGFAQKRKPVPPPPPPPPIVREISVAYPPSKQETVYEKLLSTRNSPSLAFAHIVDADTVIYPNEVFKKQLEISGNGYRMEKGFAKDTLRFTKGEKPFIGPHYVKYAFLDLKVNKDVATFTDKETKEVLKFRIFLNKQKSKITKMQDLATKQFYMPADFVGTPPMMIMN